jgi:hypothetical protein
MTHFIVISSSSGMQPFHWGIPLRRNKSDLCRFSHARHRPLFSVAVDQAHDFKLGVRQSTQPMDKMPSVCPDEFRMSVVRVIETTGRVN